VAPQIRLHPPDPTLSGFPMVEERKLPESSTSLQGDGPGVAIALIIKQFVLKQTNNPLHAH